MNDMHCVLRYPRNQNLFFRSYPLYFDLDRLTGNIVIYLCVTISALHGSVLKSFHNKTFNFAKPFPKCAHCAGIVSKDSVLMTSFFPLRKNISIRSNWMNLTTASPPPPKSSQHPPFQLSYRAHVIWRLRFSTWYKQTHKSSATLELLHMTFKFY